MSNRDSYYKTGDKSIQLYISYKIPYIYGQFDNIADNSYRQITFINLTYYSNLA